jgi:hypothetical protein
MSLASTIVETVKLDVARARLTALEGQQGKLALSAELGELGAAAKLKEWQKAVEVARAERDRLEAAFEVARKRDAAAAAAADVAARRAGFARLEQHAAAREQAAGKLSAALAAACEAYADFLASTEAMVGALPSGCQWPPAWAHHLSRAEPLIADQMWKFSRVHQINEFGAQLPGAAPLDQRNRFQPDKIEPFTNTIAASNTYLLDAVRQQIEIAEQVAGEMQSEAA